MSEVAPANSTSSQGEPRHIPALDGLRAIALLLVVFHHWCQRYDTAAWSSYSRLQKLLFFVGEGTWCGVDLFFVLSGFLITGILLDTRENPRFLSNFYLRRTLRIFPPYYFFLFLTFVVARPFLDTNATWRELSHGQLWYWLYLENWHTALYGWAPYPVLHLWSLAVEEQFYLLWPLLVFFSGPRRIIGFALAIIFLSPCLTGWLLTHASLAHPAAFTYVATITRLGPLAWGALLAAPLRLPGGISYLKRLGPILTAIGGLVLVVLLATDKQFTKADPHTQIYGYAGLGIFFAGVLAWLVTHDQRDRWVRISSTSWLRQIGKVSYVAYIVHPPLFVCAAMRFPTHPMLVLIFCTALTFALAFASWRFFEKPLLGLKNRLAPSLSAKGAPADDEPGK